MLVTLVSMTTPSFCHPLRTKGAYIGPVQVSTFTNLPALVDLQSTPMGFEQKPITTPGTISVRWFHFPQSCPFLEGTAGLHPELPPSPKAAADDQDLSIC